MNTCDLITKLHDGFVLTKIHHDNPECTEYLMSDDVGSYTKKGWCSAIGTVEERLVELITHPEMWNAIEFNVRTQEYPYPWSITFNQLKK